MQGKDDTEFDIRDVHRMRVGVVAARFNRRIADKLLEGALAELNAQGIPEENIRVLRVAGSVELPRALQMLAEEKKYDCLVAIGAIVKGETPHFDYVAKIASEGILRVMLDYKIPIGFGVLTLLDEGQSWERVESGARAARAALELASLKEKRA